MPRHLQTTIDHFSYKTLFLIVVFLLIPLVLILKNKNIKNISAAWFNDAWSYRQAINISSHTTSEPNVYITASINIGTTTKSQADNGDCGSVNFN